MKKTSIYLSTAVIVSIILSSNTPVKGETAPLDKVDIPVQEQAKIATDTQTDESINQEKTKTTDNKEVKVEDKEVPNEVKEAAVTKLESLEKQTSSDKEESTTTMQLPTAANPTDEVNIPDARLKNVLLRQLNKTDTETTDIPITVAEMETIEQIVYSDPNNANSKISSLEGLQYAKNLKTLVLSWNTISDISPISGLGIEALNLEHNTLGNANTETFKSLTKLENVDISTTLMTNYSWITQSQVKYLRAEVNNISDADLEPFRNAHNIKVLEIPTNNISDISIFKDMHSLNTLLMASNNVSDLSPLKDFTAPIRSLNFDSNKISDITPIKHVISTLEFFRANYNFIYDISPLNGIPTDKIQSILVDNQQIVLPKQTLAKDVVPTVYNPVVTLDGSLLAPTVNDQVTLSPQGGVIGAENKVFSWPNKLNESFNANWRFAKTYVKDIIQFSGQVYVEFEHKPIVPGANITVKYQDLDGNPLHQNIILQGALDEDYITELKIFTGYTFQRVDGNPQGKFTDQPQVVVYVYDTTNAANVTVKHQDANGTKLADDVIITGKIGADYNSSPVTIPGWTLKTTPDNASGKFTDQPQEVIYIYEKTNAANVTVKFVDELGNELADSVILSGKLGMPYASTPADIEGWVLKTTPDNATGVFTDQAQEVIYVYEREEGAPVNVRFQDTTGKQLSVGITLKGKLGSAYSTLPKAISGWSVKSIPDNAKGFFTTEPQEVIYVYDRATAADVTVKFVDEQGNSLADSVILTGKIGLPYESTPATINGWVLKTTPDNAKGTFTSEAQEVVYVYERANAANVTVKFVDGNGKQLVDSIVLSGKIGTGYITQAKTIPGWVLKTTPANAKGIFTDKAQDVIYVYEETKAAPVTVKFVDENGNELSASILLSGKLGELYETEAKKIEGWVLKTTPTNAKGSFTSEAQEVIYVYKKADKDKQVPPTPTPDKKTPNTGISTGIVVSEVMLVASIAYIAFILKKRSKKEN